MAKKLGIAPRVHFVALGFIAVACMSSLLLDRIGIRLWSNASGILLRGGRVKDPFQTCARDVFLTLRREGGEGEGGGNATCSGLLIRDDMILTSRECSKLSFEFDFPSDDVGSLRATPAFLSSRKKRLIDPRLGLLQADPPYHYSFLDEPTRRARVFLSSRSEKWGAPLGMSCNGDRPVAHSFPVNSELVPLGHLAKVLPKEILWEDADIDTAPEFENESDRWWTKAVSLEGEMRAFRKMLKSYKGPRGSLSLPAAHSRLFHKASALCEAVDPRGHRRPECFKYYFLEWVAERPFSGARFFDWLDFGRGKLLLESREMEYVRCLKKDFNGETVHYFSDGERDAHEVYVSPTGDGAGVVARYRLTDQPVPRSDPDDPHLYVWDLNETLYVVDSTWDKERYGRISHGGVLAGGPTLSAGKAYFGDNGTMTGINFSSGHYRPEVLSLAMMYQWMQKKGLNVTGLQWVGREDWSTDDCNEYHWNRVDIPEYNGIALNQSCHEVTTSPTWILKQDVRRK